MSRALAGALALSLLLTLALELGFFALAGRLFTGRSKRCKKDFLLVALANVLTNPAVVLLYWLAALYADINAAVVLAPLELSAIFAEGFCYKKYGGFRRPYLFSAAANIFSFGAGLLLQSVIK